MLKLGSTDANHVKAAEGWLDLGDHLEANDELEKVSPLMRAHPDVLEMYARVFAVAKKWDGVIALCETVTAQLPHRPVAWLLLAQAQDAVGETDRAYNTLLSVGDRFLEHWEISYGVARYATKLRDFASAEKWLARAFGCGGDDAKQMALQDSDLDPFWRQSSGDKIS